MRYQQRRLDPRAKAYIRIRLQDGHTLAQMILQYADLTGGEVVTLLPEQVGVEEAHDFLHGGQLPITGGSTELQMNGAKAVRLPSIDFFVTSVVDAFLEVDPQHCCILEDALARADDPHVAQLQSRVCTFQDEVYHLLLSQDLGSGSSLRAVKEARQGPFFTAALTVLSVTIARGDGDGRCFSEEQIRVLAQQTKVIVVGAYDGEGYLVWRLNKDREG